jgi:hypothetical protein
MDIQTGLYRCRGTDDLPDWVQVRDGTRDAPLNEAEYRKEGHSPPFETLAWREAYFSAQKVRASQSPTW